MNEKLEDQAGRAKEAAYKLGITSISIRNAGLNAIADSLEAGVDSIVKANAVDIDNAKKAGMSGSMLDRLVLDKERIYQIASAVRDIVKLGDVLGEVESWERPNGLVIGRKRVPLGLIGIIYESRPNVTVDAAVLCIKSGNACLLRGGSEAIRTNLELVCIMKDAIAKAGLPKHAIEIVEDTARETVNTMMKLDRYIDVLIPRGGVGLIKSVTQNATIPVIQTGTGNCHVYIDEFADIKMGLDILINAKCQRPSVCNACETLLVHEKAAKVFMPLARTELEKRSVEVRENATEEDYYTEYNDLILAVKIVKNIDEAIAHINKYNSKHSECIVTNDYANSQKFLKMVDAAAVYVNASTRFTDGFEFGFGAEIGISTQKLHARGPMGLHELTTVKYIIQGNGQIRG